MGTKTIRPRQFGYTPLFGSASEYPGFPGARNANSCPTKGNWRGQNNPLASWVLAVAEAQKKGPMPVEPAEDSEEWKALMEYRSEKAFAPKVPPPTLPPPIVSEGIPCRPKILRRSYAEVLSGSKLTVESSSKYIEEQFSVPNEKEK
ncbi:hypothetical protein SBOR_0433 [Sclerotinia borealis F-4128]|uniref:Uncharacterized protein n=1 Tax=Sclerotinia borealis (strain F-4128) TaxID=1432307 RepID=W9CX56_SCLBF|nr:hypothetical protein SBOR_0433 [Sclerotinia borealis F-4128]